MKFLISLALLVSISMALPISMESGAMTPPGCQQVEKLGRNVKWLASCTDLLKHIADPNCWEGGNVPTKDDVVVIPANTQAVVVPITEKAFTLVNVTAIVVQPQGTLTLKGSAIEVSKCIQVAGLLELEVESYNASVTQSDSKPASPGYGWDQNTHDSNPQPMHNCYHIPQGFTPRICGPGWFNVLSTGRVNVRGLYASLFLSGSIQRGGQLSVADQGFMWGQIYNDGSFSTKGYTYMHGFLHNTYQASVGTIAFDKWATSYVSDNSALFIENNGTLVVTDQLYTTNAWYADGTKGVYRAVLTNNHNVTFDYPKDGTSDGYQYAAQDFDLFNFNTVEWRMTQGQWGYGFSGQGNFVNHGTFIANNMYVMLNAFHSIGGRLVTNNGGQFNFGNGPVSSQALKLCELLPQPRHTYKRRAKPYVLSVMERDGCWWYGSFCYTTPYLLKPVEEEQEDSHQMFGAIRVKLTRALQAHKLDALVAESCDRRYSLHNTMISGDSTGSVLSTLPIELSGTTVIEKGGKWYGMTEHQHPPVFGGGTLEIRKDGAFFAGIEATFADRGFIVVKKGGTFAIPKHAKVHFKNHSIVAERGSVMHIDGQFHLHASKDDSLVNRNCGTLRGRGSIEKERKDDLSC